jgi:type I restriction enzyme, S subunit
VPETPRRFERVRLDSLVQFVGGGTPSKSRPEFFTGKIPWVTPKDMKSLEIWDSADRITPEAVEASATRLLPPNCVLVVVRSGVLKHSLPIAINRVPVAINQDMKALICNSDLCPDFLSHLLRQSAPRILQSVRGTTADNIPVEMLKAFEVSLPPLAEQRRIAAILDLADALRAKRCETIAKIDTVPQSIFAEMFGRTADILKAWPVRKLGDLLDFLTSGSRGWAEHYSESGDIFLRIQNVHKDELLLDDVATSARLERPKLSEHASNLATCC